MNRIKTALSGQVTPTPWDASSKSLIKSVQSLLDCQSFAVALLTLSAPTVDEFLVGAALDEPALKRWCHTGFRDDAMLRDAMRQGFALATNGDAVGTSGLTRQGHTLAVATPESLITDSWWWLAARRRSNPFTPEDGAAANLMLRKWCTLLDRPAEDDMGQLLIGHDDRIIAADLDTHTRMREYPDLSNQLLANVRPTLAQRYPDLQDGRVYDMALQIDGHASWVSLHRNRVVRDPVAVYWHVEIRPLEEGELPVVGVVEDDRIARAIAFLHEAYAQSPSLAAIAKHVHMSPFHFHRLFSKNVGVSPKHYHQRRQLQMARWFLRSTRTPIGTIAKQTGFSSHGHFTSTFHRVVGQSPTQYRERH